MKIKFGAIVTDGRGKLGGHVASKNRGGNYLRTKTTPVNPQTASQTAVRSIFGQISQGWSGLTEAQIEGWNNAVSEYSQTNIFGDLKEPSGKALYQRLNQSLLLVGASILSDAPATESSPSEIANQAEIDTVGSEITINDLASTAGVYVVIRSSGPVSAGTLNVKNKMRIVSTPESNAVDNAVLYTDYVAKFGTPTSGQRIFFEVNYVLPNGIQTPRIKLLAIYS